MLSVSPSVTPFSLRSHHRIIMKFLEVITNDQSEVHVKGQGQRSKVKVTEFKTQRNRFRTVWIHIWWWNDAQSLMSLRRGALLFSMSSIKFQGRTAKKIVDFDPNWTFPDCNSSLKFIDGYEMMHKAWSNIERRPIVFQGHTSNFRSGDKMDATLLSLQILYSQIHKEINIPIMICIFTQFILYDMVRDIVIKGSIIISCKITANFSFSNIRPSNCLLGMTV